jgi:hypothetical protein
MCLSTAAMLMMNALRQRLYSIEPLPSFWRMTADSTISEDIEILR